MFTTYTYIFMFLQNQETNETFTEYFYIDHPVLAENMTLTVTPLAAEFCINIQIFGSKAECE